MEELFKQMEMTFNLFTKQAEEFIKKEKEIKIKEISSQLDYLYWLQSKYDIDKEDEANIKRLEKELKELQGEK